MTILALESSAGACSAALGCADGALLASRFEAMQRGQSERLMPMVDEVFHEAKLVPRDVELIAVSVGPGAFTGVRLGLAAARGLGLALERPVLGVTSMEVVATAQPLSDGAPILVAIDSKRGDYFTQVFFTETPDQPLRPKGDPVALDVEELVARALALAFDGSRILVAGDAQATVLEQLKSANVPAAAADGPALPDAATLAQIAAARLNQDPTLAKTVSGFPEPLYLRPPDVSAPNRDRARAPGQ